MVPEKSDILITVGDLDVTGDVIFAQTNFQSVAGAQAGSCMVTLRGAHRVMPGRDLIALYVNGQKLWWGYPFQVEQGYIFPDDPEPMVVLHGVDLNVLFDKLVMYNHAHPTWYPDGGGTYKRQKVVGEDGKVSGYVVSVPQHTLDKDYIQTMLKDFDLALVSPHIKWGQDSPHDCRIYPISEINTGDNSATWTPPGSGTTLRGFFEDVSRNIVRSQPGSAVWYIDPEGYIVWKEQDTDWAFYVGDADSPDVTPVRNLSVTTDVSRIKNDVLVFTGTLDPTPQSTQEFLRYVHKINDPSATLFGRFQWSETMGSDWMQGMINARASKILNQEGTPAMRGEFTLYRPGLYPGQIVSIFSDVHTFITYDPTFGIQELDHVNIPIRSLDMTFPTPDVVEFRVTCSFDTQDPWGLILALKRPATRGMVQPNFNVIDRTDPAQASMYIDASPMVLVKEYPERLSGNRWQCTYAYVRHSLTVVVNNLRLTSIPEPESGVRGFLETDPDNGIFMTEASITSRVYVEYHVWHNLDSSSI